MTRPKPLPAASLHVVLALLDGELHGYALMRRVEELSDGAVRMGPGTLYGTINRLLDTGLIERIDAVERSRVRRSALEEHYQRTNVVCVNALEFERHVGSRALRERPRSRSAFHV